MSALEPSYPLRTERLVLRPFEFEDFDALLAMYSSPDVVTYLYHGPRGADEVRRLLDDKIGSTSIADEGDKICLAVTLAATGEVIGDVVLMWLSAAHRQGEIGYVVHPDHQGKGYATEATAVLLDLAFGDERFHRIVGRAEGRNAASARVLEHHGMRREALLVENEWVKDEWQSELVYAILGREWRANRSD